MAGKVFDRMSKGIREAPGKALIGELAAASGDRPEGAFGAPCFYKLHLIALLDTDSAKLDCLRSDCSPHKSCPCGKVGLAV